jgi:hypothetical protein
MNSILSYLTFTIPFSIIKQPYFLSLSFFSFSFLYPSTTKWLVTITTTTTATLPLRLLPPVAATSAIAAAHLRPIFPHHYQTHFSKPLLLTFSNLPQQTIITIPILNLRNSTPAIFIHKANTSTTNDSLRTQASKKSQRPTRFSPH